MGFETTNRLINKRINSIASKLSENQIDDRELNELVTLIYPKLKYFVWTFCKNENDTEEALQWSLEKIFKNIDKFENSKAKFTTWVYTITRHETLFYLYKKNQRPTVNIDTMYSICDDHDSNEYVHEIDNLYEKTVSEIYNIEDEVSRNIAIDKMIKNHRIKEISVRYDINENTVKTKLRKIRSDLKREVTRKNPDLVNHLNNIFKS
jgi:RNA polymerase sigma-70 factor (ECF subfamily)